MLNLDRNRRPFWTAQVTVKGWLTIRASVDYSDGTRRCHYFVDDGRIYWARDSHR